MHAGAFDVSRKSLRRNKIGGSKEKNGCAIASGAMPRWNAAELGNSQGTKGARELFVANTNLDNVSSLLDLKPQKLVKNTHLISVGMPNG